MSGDARPAGGGWTLRAICVLGAAAMAAAGAYLFEPALADLGFYVERGKYALAGYTLIYAALLVAFAATAGVLRTGSAVANYAFSITAGPIALFALGMLFTTLTVDAVFFRDPPVYWAGVLVIPAALCFAASSLSEWAERQAAAGESAQAPQRGILAGFLIVLVYFILSLAAVILYVNAGYLLFYLLQMNLLEGSDLDLTRIGPALVEVLYGIVVERWLFVVIMGTLGAVLIYAFAGLAAAGARVVQSEPQESDPQDEAFVARAAQQLRDYAAARGYDRDARRLAWAVFLPMMFLPMLIALVVGTNLATWVPRPYGAAELQSLGWTIYERSAGPSLVIMMFAALLWGALPNAVISRIWRSYSEAAGWSGFATQQVSIETYVRIRLRSGSLSRDAAFEPGAFLHRVNTMFEPYFLYSAVAASLLAAIAWHHDMSRYHLLTDRYVEVMDYWTLERHRYGYASVREVRLACTYDDGRPAASIGLVLPDGFSIEVLDGQAADRVSDLARLDALIPDSVPRTYATRKPAFRDEVSDFDPICVEELALGLDEAEGGRLRDIFRVEAWHRARWRERIGAARQAGM